MTIPAYLPVPAGQSRRQASWRFFVAETSSVVEAAAAVPMERSSWPPVPTTEDWEKTLRLRGYSFVNAADAQRAKASVIEALGMTDGDASIAELAEDGTVLGVRLPEDAVAQAERILTEHGAERLVDVDESWTRPRTMGGG